MFRLQNSDDEYPSEIYSKFQCQNRTSSGSSNASTSSTDSYTRYGSSFTQKSCHVLANALHSNWMENFSDEIGYDDSLTNLSWLHNVNPIKINEQLSHRPVMNFPKERDTSATYLPQIFPNNYNQNKQWSNTSERFQLPVSNNLSTFEQPDYKNNPNLKPTFSYAILISWAMKDLGKPKITLSEIYNWIMENFAYYRFADFSWQNSVRHNLSLGKCFEKVPRRKDEPGKGGFWRINPQHAKALDSSLLKIKYNPTSRYIDNIKYDNTFSHPGYFNQVCEPMINTQQNYPTPPPAKRSRKSPITVTREEPNVSDRYSDIPSTHYCVTAQPTVQIDKTSNSFENYIDFDLPSYDNSSSESNNYGTLSDEVSLPQFDDSSLTDILNSPMALDKEDFIDHDDFNLLNSNSDFNDFFFTGKDDLQELDCLLGIF